MENRKTTESPQEIRCWFCRRNRSDLKRTAKQYWDRGEVDENLCVEIIKDGVYQDVGFEVISIRKRISKETMQIWVCAICAKLIRTILKSVLKGIKAG